MSFSTLLFTINMRILDHLLGGEDRCLAADRGGDRVEGRESISISDPLTEIVIEA